MKLDIGEMLAGSLHRMSHVNRYSSIPVTRKENVSEHSWYVAMYAYLVGKDLATAGVKVDFGELLSRALVHDLDESMTGDFLRYVKYGHPDLKRALDEVSVSMIEKMSAELSVQLLPHWKNAKADDIEGHIIAVVDLARVISYVNEEYATGNTHVLHILSECCEYIDEFSKEHPDSPVVPYAQAIISWVGDNG